MQFFTSAPHISWCG